MQKTRFALFLAVCSAFIIFSGQTTLAAAPGQNGPEYLPFADTLEKAGFASRELSGGKVFFMKGSVSLYLDKKTQTVFKNPFTFSLDAKTPQNGDISVKKTQIEKIIGQSISQGAGGLVFSAFETSPHSWLYGPGFLVAHALGGVDGSNGENSKEALIEAYNNGFTVFETDLRLTNDGFVVCAHDLGDVSRQAFLSKKTGGARTPLELETLLRIMAVTPDMVIITDTKSFEDTREHMIAHFETIVRLAKNIGEGLLERVVPQIYNREMYEAVKAVYPFESVIYTLYASPDDDGAVCDFVENKPDVRVVTMAPERMTPRFAASLSERGTLIYLFTVNDPDYAKALRKKGAYGIYTDFLVLSDFKK